MIFVDTTQIFGQGGRLAKPCGLLGSVLKVKPLLILHEEKFVVSGVARTRDKAIQRLYDFVTALSQAGKIAVSYSTDEDDAETLAKRIRKEFPDAPLYLTRIGPVLGTTRGGPRGDGGGGQRGVTNDGKAQVFRD